MGKQNDKKSNQKQEWGMDRSSGRSRVAKFSVDFEKGTNVYRRSSTALPHPACFQILLQFWPMYAARMIFFSLTCDFLPYKQKILTNKNNNNNKQKTNKKSTPFSKQIEGLRLKAMKRDNHTYLGGKKELQIFFFCIGSCSPAILYLTIASSSLESTFHTTKHLRI